ncbi:FHA domain-containing protein [Hypnocyclicus thermotrophus]|uniref:FHA domain-containing protein n=1 Tax=Hypnocyclicus thermotrophus TaxID=1627895 RepID=A0AA46E0H6_9FUSO|nr:FHA domain-containing protein [Hypnocyclicus thermotrophus]TDT72407.1 FHA domain-containing protein [Hypnocyclicus thermotrophus]
MNKLYSIKEISNLAKNILDERYKKKGWLLKKLEVISAETVIKNIKKGDSLIKENEKINDEVKKIYNIQDALLAYYVAFHRSNEKDKRAIENIKKNKIRYLDTIKKYIELNIDKKNNYENIEILENLINILKIEKLEQSLLLEKRFFLNKEAINTFNKIEALNYNDYKIANEEFKTYFKYNLPIIKELKAKIIKKYNENINNIKEFLNGNKNIENIKEKLIYISYINPENYKKLKNIINNYYKMEKIILFLESDNDYNNYIKLEELKKEYNEIKSINFVVPLLINTFNKLNNKLKKYNKIYFRKNLQEFFNNNHQEVYDKLFLVENYYSKTDKKIIDLYFLELITILDEIDIDKKLNKLENLIETDINLDTKDILIEELMEYYKKEIKNYNFLDEYTIKIYDNQYDIFYNIINKNKITIGRSRINDIVLNSKFVSRKEHLIINLEKMLFENPKFKIFYIDNEISDIVNEKEIKKSLFELNIGNVFTFKVIVKENYILFIPYEDKTNIKECNEFSFEDFKKNIYIIIIKNSSLYFDKYNVSDIEIGEEEFSLEYLDNKYFINYKDKMKRVVKKIEFFIDNRYKVSIK